MNRIACLATFEETKLSVSYPQNKQRFATLTVTTLYLQTANEREYDDITNTSLQ